MGYKIDAKKDDQNDEDREEEDGEDQIDSSANPEEDSKDAKIRAMMMS